MCIMLLKPKEKVFSDELYKECFFNNPDGAGIAYVENGKLVVRKGFFHTEEALKEIRSKESGEMLIHFRKANRGKIDDDNCHPFFVQSDEETKQFSFAIAHNGTLDWFSTKDKSDTMCFIDDILGAQLKRDPWFLDTAAGVVLVEKFLGGGNKMIVLRYDSDKNESKTYILNQKLGNMHEGTWFSNWSWKKIIKPQPMPYSPGTYWVNGVQKNWADWKPGQSALKLLDHKEVFNGGRETNHFFPEDFWVKKNPEVGKIEVPRDSDAILDSDDYEIGLSHLNKKERKAIARFASDITRKICGPSAVLAFTKMEKIQFARSEIRSSVIGARDIKTIDIDNLILTNHISVDELVSKVFTSKKSDYCID